MNVKNYWKETKDKPWFLGAFRWTGFDYLGESFGWPARTMSFGVIDLAGFPTDIYYLYQSIWSDVPMVRMLPHWTHHGKEGTEIPVVVYTNCSEAELFLNGKSLGKKPMTDDLEIVWYVPYQPGELRVVAKTGDGNEISKIYRTASKEAGIRLSPDKIKAEPNLRDVIMIEASIIDDHGVDVPYADNLIQFHIEGPGTIIGVENGDILDLSPHKVDKRKAFNGKCLVMVQTTQERGKIQVTAKSKLLKEAVTEIIVD